MGFTGNEDHSITIQEAAELTKNYRDTVSGDDVRAGFFGKTTLQNILNQPDCVGIRFYYGLSDAGIPQIVLVGADSDENDLVNEFLAERATPCPPDCASGSILSG